MLSWRAPVMSTASSPPSTIGEADGALGHVLVRQGGAGIDVAGVDVGQRQLVLEPEQLLQRDLAALIGRGDGVQIRRRQDGVALDHDVLDEQALARRQPRLARRRCRRQLEARPLARQELRLRAGPAGCRAWCAARSPGRPPGRRPAPMPAAMAANAAATSDQLPARHGRIQACRFLAVRQPALGSRATISSPAPASRRRHRGRPARRRPTRSDPGAAAPAEGSGRSGEGGRPPRPPRVKLERGPPPAAAQLSRSRRLASRNTFGGQLQVRAEIGLQAADHARWSCRRPRCRPRSP